MEQPNFTQFRFGEESYPFKIRQTRNYYLLKNIQFI
jgi:hypothetical protein